MSDRSEIRSQVFGLTDRPAWELVGCSAARARFGIGAEHPGPEMNFYYPLFDLMRELAWCLAGPYSALMALPVAFRSRPRARLDVRQWRVRYQESAGDRAEPALAPPTDREA